MSTPSTAPDEMWPKRAGHPLRQAHRGFSAGYPENTLVAFAAAVPHADVIETDIRTTADGVMILFHDKVLTRTTNVREVYPSRCEDPVESFTYEEIRRLDAGSWFAPQFASTPVPTLQQGLDLLADTGLAVLLEIKQAGFDDVGRVVRETRARHAGMRLALGAIDPEVVRQASTAVPEVPAAVLAVDQETLSEDRLADFGSFAAFLGFRNAYLRSEVLEAVHAGGMGVLHGSNTPEIMLDDIARGVNIRGTDEPALSAAVAAGWSGRSLEAEDLVVHADGPASAVRREKEDLAIPFKPSGQAAMVITSNAAGDWTALPVKLDRVSGVGCRLLTGPRGGCYEVVWDGQPVARVDTYSPSPARRRLSVVDRAAAGVHELRFVGVGVSPCSQGTEIGVDVIDVTHLPEGSR